MPFDGAARLPAYTPDYADFRFADAALRFQRENEIRHHADAAKYLTSKRASRVGLGRHAFCASAQQRAIITRDTHCASYADARVELHCLLFNATGVATLDTTYFPFTFAAQAMGKAISASASFQARFAARVFQRHA